MRRRFACYELLLATVAFPILLNFDHASELKMRRRFTCYELLLATVAVPILQNCVMLRS